MPHFSHRSGVDADLLFYVTTLEGIPVPSPGFIHVGADGLALDERSGRWLRLDVEREWKLVKALVSDPEGRVEWLFVSDVVQAMVLEWAYALGESPATTARARAVMREPHPGGVHDDHIHVRTMCSSEEVAAGCEIVGPRRSWLSDATPTVDVGADDDDVRALLEPMSAQSAALPPTALRSLAPLPMPSPPFRASLP